MKGLSRMTKYLKIQHFSLKQPEMTKKLDKTAKKHIWINEKNLTKLLKRKLLKSIFGSICTFIIPFTTEGPAAGPYINTVSSSDTWLIIITRNRPISIEMIRGYS